MVEGYPSARSAGAYDFAGVDDGPGSGAERGAGDQAKCPGDAVDVEPGDAADDESGECSVRDAAKAGESVGVSGEMSSVGVLCCCFEVASGSLRQSFFFDFSEDCPEPGHAPVAAEVGDGVPGQVADLGEEDGDSVSGEMPGVVVAESLPGDLGVERIDGDCDLACGGHGQVAVGVADDRIADEVLGDSSLKGGVVLVLAGPLPGEPLRFVGRVARPAELDPVCAGRDPSANGWRVAAHETVAVEDTAVAVGAARTPGVCSRAMPTANEPACPACLWLGVCHRGGFWGSGGSRTPNEPVGPARMRKMPASRYTRS